MAAYFQTALRPGGPGGHLIGLEIDAHPAGHQGQGTLKREIPVIFDDIPYDCPALTAAE